MITARTKRQLLIFVLITLVGVAYVGARYARLDRLVFTTDYTVKSEFVDSGGIFKGAEVTYRGVKVGQVSALDLTRSGVDVMLQIEKGQDKIPANTIAVVGNKSAVGEQYVELQPQSNAKPYLKDGSVIGPKNTEIPISTTELLTNVDGLVDSVPQGDLRTVISELGTAFKGTGGDLSQIIDTSNAFIKAADRNFDVTSGLIRDSNTVLQTQVDKTSAIKDFSKNLSLFSGTLAGSDADLRKVIDNGSATTDQLRTFIEQNRVNLAQLLNQLVITGKVVVKHLDGIRQTLVIYPYLVEGAYSVVGREDGNGPYDANFGLVLTMDGGPCEQGYNAKVRNPETGRADIGMDFDAKCTEPPSKSNARGSSHSPNNRAATSYRAPTVATYDHKTGKVDWTNGDKSPKITYTGGAADTFGKDSWKWLLLQPVAAKE